MSLLQKWIDKNLFVDPRDAMQLSTVVKLFRATLNTSQRIEWPPARVEQELAAKIVSRRHNARDTKFLAGWSLVDPAIEVARQEAARREAARVEAERLEAEQQEAARVKAERLEAKRLEVERLAAEDAYIARWEAANAEREAISFDHAFSFCEVWNKMLYAPGQSLSFAEIANKFNSLNPPSEGVHLALTADIVRVILNDSQCWPYVGHDAFRDHAWRPQCLCADGSLKRWVDREDGTSLGVSSDSLDEYLSVSKQIAEAPRAPGYDLKCNWRQLLAARAEQLAQLEIV